MKEDNETAFGLTGLTPNEINERLDWAPEYDGLTYDFGLYDQNVFMTFKGCEKAVWLRYHSEKGSQYFVREGDKYLEVKKDENLPTGSENWLAWSQVKHSLEDVL